MSTPARFCTYCLGPEADACVSTHPDGQHIYAHQSCAAERGVRTLYVFLDEPAARPQ